MYNVALSVSAAKYVAILNRDDDGRKCHSNVMNDDAFAFRVRRKPEYTE